VPLDALLDAAADGRLPDWAQLTRRRLAHVERVATLLGEWAAALELADDQRRRWRAAGWLHDALREAPTDELRPFVPSALRYLSPKLLHGPAAAERLRQDGVDDEPLLRAITFHTIGHPELDELGRALFIADFIEPGRRYEPARLAAFRARMPAAREQVLRDVLHARMERLLKEGRPIRSETAAFWNALNGSGS
jgi:predicted HD superfamily hydrolase involved in NAD metabolism